MFKSSEGRWRKRMHQPGTGGRAPNDRRLSIDPAAAISSSLSTATSGAGGNHRALQMTRHSSAASPAVCSSESAPQLPPRENAGWVVEPGAFEVGGAADHPSQLPRTAAESNRHRQLQERQQQQQQQQQRQEAQSASIVATLIMVSVVTYVLYRASVEALIQERTRDFFDAGGGTAVKEAFQFGTEVAAAAATASVGGDGVGIGDEAAVTAGGGAGLEFPGPEASPAGIVWGRGVSLVTVSAWQSMSALGAGFLMSRFWRRGRKPEPSALGDADRTRRNRCLLVFAAAHLAGAGLEYYGYGVIGPTAAEVLRSTETALFCLLSLSFGMQRLGLASVPTLLLALGLALAATPASGEFRVGWGGLQASLAANVLLAIRAVAAKAFLDDYGLDEIGALFTAAKMTAGIQFGILLVVEVPRAASGLPPRLLPHLWGVGVAGGGHHDGVVGGGGVGPGWESSGVDRTRLACLLLANGLCLYGHVLALLGLLSRLSATMFAISSGYVHACLVFVLLLSMKGSATGPRSAGMALATVAVVVHLYRSYTRGRMLPPASDGEGPNVGRDLLALREGGEGGGGGSASPGMSTLPQLPVFLREESATDDSGSGNSAGGEDRNDSTSTPGSRRAEGGGRQPTALFVPLLGTRHQEGSVRPDWERNDLSDGVGDEEAGGGEDIVGGGVSPGLRETFSATPQFAWTWMGLRPTGTPTPPLLTSESDGRDEQSKSLPIPRFSSESPLLQPKPAAFGNARAVGAGGAGPNARSTGRDVNFTGDQYTAGNSDYSIIIPSSSSPSSCLGGAPPAAGAAPATPTSAYSSNGGCLTRSPPSSLGLRYQPSDGSRESERGDDVVVGASASTYGSGSAADVSLSSEAGIREVSAPENDQQRAWGSGSASSGGSRRDSGMSTPLTNVSPYRGLAAPGSRGGGGIRRMERLRRDDGSGSRVEGAGFGGHLGRMSVTGARHGSSMALGGGAGGGAIMLSSPTSSSSFSLNGFEVIDKDDMWN